MNRIRLSFLSKSPSDIGFFLKIVKGLSLYYLTSNHKIFINEELQNLRLDYNFSSTGRSSHVFQKFWIQFCLHWSVWVWGVRDGEEAIDESIPQAWIRCIMSLVCCLNNFEWKLSFWKSNRYLGKIWMRQYSFLQFLLWFWAILRSCII